PDQVAGAQPGEDLGEDLAVEVPAAAGQGGGRAGQVPVGEGGRYAGPALVEDADHETQSGQPVLFPGGGEVCGDQAGQDAAGAYAGQDRARGTADPLDRVECVEHGPQVGVQAPGGVPGVGVAPGQDEDLLPRLDQVLDPAPPRRQVQHVE